MIIMVRGNHGSGKSTVVRNVKNKLLTTPIYGILGPRNPEAYRCWKRELDPVQHAKARYLYILGPYEQPTTAGCDYVTKKGMPATLEFLTKYNLLGNALFESAMMSARIMAPTVGAWLDARKSDVVVVNLSTTPEQCRSAINARQKDSIAIGKPSIHFEAQQRMIDRVTQQLTDKGYRMVYADREKAHETILGLL